MKKIIKIEENEVVTIEGNYIIIEDDISSNRKVEITTKLDILMDELLLGAREIGLVNENTLGKKVSNGVTADGSPRKKIRGMF